MKNIEKMQRKPKHMTSIGGQAIIEGIMMKGPKDVSIAVRKPDGQIEVKKESINYKPLKKKLLKIPLLRGSVALFDAMITGTKALMYSAEFYEEEDIEPGKFDLFMEKLFGDKAENIAIYLSVFVSLLLAVFIFMLGPSFITNFLKSRLESPILLNLFEGILRLAIFLLYVFAISKMKDIKRVFEYHGAEHKTIHCYESELELTVDNVKKFTTLHPRCGTSFLFMVMIVSIIVFSFFGWPNPLMRFLSRIIMLPVIAGISYEINKLTGKSDGVIARITSYPGLMLQKITTNEPDNRQIEVAIEALKQVIVDDKEADRW